MIFNKAVLCWRYFPGLTQNLDGNDDFPDVMQIAGDQETYLTICIKAQFHCNISSQLTNTLFVTCRVRIS